MFREDKHKVAVYMSLLIMAVIDAIALLVALVLGIMLGVGAILQSQGIIIAAIFVAAINVLEIIFILICLLKTKD